VARYLRCIELRPDEVSFYHRATEAALRGGMSVRRTVSIAQAPETLVSTTEFRCRVLLIYHQLLMNVESGLKLVNSIDDEDKIDLLSARAIGRFLNYAAD
jgi:hypothetical protein